MKSRIAPYLRYLLTLAESDKLEALIVVDVQLGPEGQIIPTVGCFAEAIDPEAAGRIVQHFRGVGTELREGLTAGGAPYPPPAEIKSFEPRFIPWGSKEEED
jgi:hypothetical protein